jgi:hypothetical protein
VAYVHSTIADLAALAQHCARVNSLSALAGHVEAAVRDIGFRWFSLIKLVDLQRDEQQGIIIQDYPTTWFEEIVEKRLFDDSAILTASTKSATASTTIATATSTKSWRWSSAVSVPVFARRLRV